MVLVGKPKRRRDHLEELGVDGIDSLGHDRDRDLTVDPGWSDRFPSSSFPSPLRLRSGDYLFSRRMECRGECLV